MSGQAAPMTAQEALLRAVMAERYPPAAIEREAWGIREGALDATARRDRDTDLAVAARRRLLRSIDVTPDDTRTRRVPSVRAS